MFSWRLDFLPLLNVVIALCRTLWSMSLFNVGLLGQLGATSNIFLTSHTMRLIQFFTSYKFGGCIHLCLVLEELEATKYDSSKKRSSKRKKSIEKVLRHSNYTEI
ncbi:hypothetical protein ACH5RR_001304 [Cinchona calisaya]|uniref:Uncharacterized protein n=1 Tax=Cinchona calisaya TaxID=153742 RepID=A0ABD3B355_9GENT